MHEHYDNGLIAVSIAVAVLASYTALTLALRIRSTTGWPARAWLLGGGMAMGIGIWAMHFVGMLALTLPVRIRYDFWITAASMAIAIVVSTFALRIAGCRHVTRPRLVGAGIAMGVGVCAMHYVGMAAIVLDPPIRYDPFWVISSLAIAIAASFGALWVAFNAGDDRWSQYRLLLGGAGMGLAIAGMHYAGMAAAHFPVGARSATDALLDPAWLAGAVTAISVFILLAALVLAIIDAHASRQRRMQASLAEAQESSRAKDEFLAMLGHELRNPLAAISNASFLLKRAAPQSDEWRFAQEVIERQSSNLKRIVDDLLDVGRAISGKMAVELQPVDLRATVQTALDMLVAAGRTEARTIDWRGSDVSVLGDSTRLQQVVINLVVNAVENSPRGGVIEVRLARVGGEACLTVRDHGVGLDPETARRVFDLFFQGTQGIHRGKGGLGVGLTLVRRIVELHRGQVSAASEGPGKGALFSVRLPAMDAAVARDARSEGAAAPRQRRKVLVIEDAQDARESLRMALETRGHTVHTAADGASGLQALLELAPDIALIDIGLPAVDGFDFARRARSAGVDARLVALTGYGLSADKSKAAEAGFDVHLTKPADIDKVLALVAQSR